MSTDAKLSINVTLHPGATTQSVTVRGATPLLQTQTGEQSITVATQQVSQLPLPRTGNVLNNMMQLSPGIDCCPSGWTTSEGGTPRQDQQYVDGALATQFAWGGTAVLPTPDTIAEVKVMTNAFSAVYGNSGGSITLATTKSGTNQFHGDVYEYLENQKLNAGNFFTHKVPKHVYNEPGFTIGGPIRKNKLFFFGDAEWNRTSGQSVHTGLTVPGSAWTSGDFSNVLGHQVGNDALGRPTYRNEIFNYSTQRAVTAGQVDPATGLTAVQSGYVRDPFPGNIIPQANLNASALALQKLYPAPNVPGAILNNYNAFPVSFTHQHQWDVRIDYYLSAKDRLMFRWSSIYSDSFGGYPYPGGGAYTPFLEEDQAPVLDWVHIFGPATTNDVHVSYFHDKIARYPIGYGQVGDSTYGIQGLPNNHELLGIPQIGNGSTGVMAMAGSSGTTMLGSPSDDWVTQGQGDIFVTDLFTHIYGKHTVEFGGEVQRLQLNNFQPLGAAGDFAFNNDFTNQYTGTGVALTGYDYASFLLGLPANLNYQQYTNYFDSRASVYALFAEDDFRVKRNLTLNLGLRWDAPLYWHAVNNYNKTAAMAALYTWNGTTATFQQLGVNGFRGTEWNQNWDSFGPRIGIAWSPSWLHNTVFRAGYGLFTGGQQQNGQFGTLPPNPGWYAYYSNGEFSDSLTAALTAPRGLTLSSISNPIFNPITNILPSIVANHNPYQRNEQYNVGIQHEFLGTMFNVAYAGSHVYYIPVGYSTTVAVPLNVIPPNLWSTCQGKALSPTGGKCLPYSQYGSGALTLNTGIGENMYNSLQITATRHFSKGLSILAAYTWAKNLNVGEHGWRYPLTDRYADHAWDPFTTPQRFTIGYVYALPFGSGERLLTHGPLVPILGNWQISGITTFQSGWPLYVTGANTCPGCGNYASSVDTVGNPVPSGLTQNTAHWFDPSAFTEPALWTVGNAGFNGLFFGPGESNFDISLSKSFHFPRLGESRYLQFRADFFNAFNTPWLGNPNTNIQSTAAGKITGTQNSPRAIQFALKFWF